MLCVCYIFREGLDKHIFVMERNSSKHVPALTWFKVRPPNRILILERHKKLVN